MLDYGEIILHVKDINEQIMPTRIIYTFVLYYDKQLNKTIALLYHQGLRYDLKSKKKFSPKLFENVYNAIKSVTNLPYTTATNIYYGNDLQISAIDNGMPVSWSNVTPHGCKQCHIMANRKKAPYEKITTNQIHYEYICGLLETVMNNIFALQQR